MDSEDLDLELHTAAVEDATDEKLIQELTSRGFVVIDASELEQLYDAFYVDPKQAAERARMWIGRQTGRFLRTL